MDCVYSEVNVVLFVLEIYILILIAETEARRTINPAASELGTHRTGNVIYLGLGQDCSAVVII